MWAITALSERLTVIVLWTIPGDTFNTLLGILKFKGKTHGSLKRVTEEAGFFYNSQIVQSCHVLIPGRLTVLLLISHLWNLFSPKIDLKNWKGVDKESGLKKSWQ